MGDTCRGNTGDMGGGHWETLGDIIRDILREIWRDWETLGDTMGMQRILMDTEERP
jgi:hypothetical protein